MYTCTLCYYAITFLNIDNQKTVEYEEDWSAFDAVTRSFPSKLLNHCLLCTIPVFHVHWTIKSKQSESKSGLPIPE